MTTLKKIGVLSAAKLEGLIGLVLGLIIAIPFAIFGAAIAAIFGGDSNSAGLLSGLGAIILLPIMYGVFGFIAGAIGAAVYNLVAKWIGGLEIEIEEKKIV